jgi:hypothetical protein
VTRKPKMNPPTWAKNATPPRWPGAEQREVRLEELVEVPQPEAAMAPLAPRVAVRPSAALPSSSVIAVCVMIAANPPAK